MNYGEIFVSSLFATNNYNFYNQHILRERLPTAGSEPN